MGEIEETVSRHMQPKSSPRSSWADKLYSAVTREGGIIQRSRGVLSNVGPDSIDFLQRMSTNDINQIKDSGLNCSTVLTTEKGRIVDIVDLLNTGDSFLMLTSEGTQQRVKEWLEKYIIMENIVITDVTPGVSTYTVIGLKILHRLEFSTEPLVSDPPTNISCRDPRTNSYIFRDRLWNFPTFSLISQTENHIQAGSSELSMDQDIFETLRIENGVP